MNKPCIHCSQVGSHHPDCLVAFIERGSRTQADVDRLTETKTIKFVAVRTNIMQGAKHIATAISKTFAKRIANALNKHTPNSEGV